MSSQLEEVEAEALKLTPEERAHLADRLLAILGEDAELEEAWAIEVERRVADIEGGRAHLVPAACENSRRPRESGDPVSFVQKTLDSLPAFAGTKGRGNDEHLPEGS
jgi:putative addiction module component (TIGR02574 family)